MTTRGRCNRAIINRSSQKGCPPLQPATSTFRAHILLQRYYLMFCDIDCDYKANFVTLLSCLERFQAKKHTRDSLEELQRDLVFVLAKLEIQLPRG